MIASPLQTKPWTMPRIGMKKRARSETPTKTTSIAVRLAILSIAIGHYTLGKNVVVDAFQPHNNRFPLQTKICHKITGYSPFVSFDVRSRITSCRRVALRASPDDNEETIRNNDTTSFVESTKTRLQQAVLPSLSVVWWPLFAAMGIPALVTYARSFPPNSSEQFAAVTLLIVANRIYLYALGLTIVATAAVRGVSSGDPKELGQRLTVLTEELLVLEKPLTKASDNTLKIDAELETNSDAMATESTTPSATPSFVKKMVDDSGLEENLDGVDAKTQALVLPAVVAGLLAISVISIPIFSDGFLATANDTPMDAEWIIELKASLSKVLPFLSQVWNAILLTLFTRAEFRRIGFELLGIGDTPNDNDNEEITVPKTQIIVECFLAVAVTVYGAYYLQYWPAQNFVNSAIAILVARAIRLDSFNAVASALALLALYDGASVLLIPAAANAAMDAVASFGGAAGSSSIMDNSLALTAASNPASSAMGSVAMQKLNSGGFQPGLLVTKLDGDKLTGTLGLGDAVFPSILASFLKRFDEDSNNQCSDENNKSKLFESSLGGYVLGCLACEFAPSIATRGVPALVFIIPFMGLATLLAASQAGCLEELRNYNNETSE